MKQLQYEQGSGDVRCWRLLVAVAVVVAADCRYGRQKLQSGQLVRLVELGAVVVDVEEKDRGRVRAFVAGVD